MNLYDLFFGAGPALQVIFKLGYMPKDSEFYELTCEQYKAFFESCGYTDEKVFMLLPEERKNYQALALDEIICMTESERGYLKGAASIVEQYCEKSGRQFGSYLDKLRYVASVLPDVFSKDTPFAKTPSSTV